jgi:hypothetical protein
MRKTLPFIGLLLLSGFAFAAQQRPAPLKPTEIVEGDSATLARQLRAGRHVKKGGIEKAKTESDDDRVRSFPHFTSSFTVAGQTFPYTMVGYPPATGRTANLRSVIVPLRMKFVGFAEDHTFEPTIAVNNIANSPIYEEARFVNGVGQFGDLLQRTTFWNKMDSGRRWHVRMSEPRVAKPVTVQVTPGLGALRRYRVDPANTLHGLVDFEFLDSTLHTILQFTDVGPDELPIFVTYNVWSFGALGYHDAFRVANEDGTETLQTLLYTSWLDTNLTNPNVLTDIFADISTFNHEVGEWLNDPYVNNIVPTWMYPPASDPRADCSDNPFLEVGDPQGNGATFDDFPTIKIRVSGYTYHLQQLVMLPWFADEVPSSAQNGWYTYPDPTSLTTPAVYCP